MAKDKTEKKDTKEKKKARKSEDGTGIAGTTVVEDVSMEGAVAASPVCRHIFTGNLE